MFPFQYFLTIIALVGGINVVGFLITAITKTHKITDLLGAGSFVVATVHMTFLNVEEKSKNLVGIVNVLVIVWGVRLAGYLFYRILHTHEDKRLSKFFPKPNEGYLDKSQSNFPIGLGIFWTLQSLWALILLIPVVYINSLPWTTSTASVTESIVAVLHDLLPLGLTVNNIRTPLESCIEFGGFVCHLLGITGMIVGFTIEALADYQKYTYKENQKIEKAKKKKEARQAGSQDHPNHSEETEEEEEEDHWCDYGLWKYSQFPNYFGELLFWWSVYLTTLPSVASYALLMSSADDVWSAPLLTLLCSLCPPIIALLSPLFITWLLLCISGIPLLQAKHQRLYGHRAAYQEYVQRTPLLLPAWSLTPQQEAECYANVERVVNIMEKKQKNQTAVVGNVPAKDTKKTE